MYPTKWRPFRASFEIEFFYSILFPVFRDNLKHFLYFAFRIFNVKKRTVCEENKMKFFLIIKINC